MPYTPFHFGAGILFKAGVARQLSFLSFATTQVVIDLESWYFLTRGLSPVHRTLHTFLGASLVGVTIGAFVWSLARAVRWGLGARAEGLSIGKTLPVFRSEVTLAGALVGGLIGGVTHVLLDSVVHTDIVPFDPFAAANPFHGIATWAHVEGFCVVAGLAGGLILAIRRRIWRATA